MNKRDNSDSETSASSYFHYQELQVRWLIRWKESFISSKHDITTSYSLAPIYPIFLSQVQQDRETMTIKPDSQELQYSVFTQGTVLLSAKYRQGQNEY